MSKKSLKKSCDYRYVLKISNDKFKKKLAKAPTNSEKVALVDYLEEHLELARNQFSSAEDGKCKLADQWQDVACLINALGGAHKTGPTWKKYWEDLRKYKLHKKPCLQTRETPYPSVSIIKPLMGDDPNLFLNLETFFTMQYPLYEILFCIEEKTDPTVKIVEKLRDKFPLIDAHLFIGGSKIGVNPKINNMYPAYVAAKYELVLISDSGIKMKEDTLLDMVQHMTDKVALVHQMPFTCDRDGFAATFEKIYFGTVQSRIYLVADLFGINCHTGMSCLVRKNILDELGGMKAFACYLAEDFFLSKTIKDNGWKISISSQPAWQNSGICDITSFQQRLIRWAKLRIAMIPFTIILEPFAECFVVGAFASWAVSILFRWDSLVFYLVHILVWFLSDWILLSIVQNSSLPFNKFEFVIGWLFREITGPYLFLNALWNPVIRWRTRFYKLAWGGIARELTPKTKL